jgi:putative sigma-54 modulation protein
MKVSVIVQNVNNSERVKTHAENKIQKLKHVYDEILSAEVVVKKTKAMDPSPKLVEIKIHVSGIDLFAKKESNSAEEAIDGVIEALTRQLIKFKDKKRDKDTIEIEEQEIEEDI